MKKTTEKKPAPGKPVAPMVKPTVRRKAMLDDGPPPDGPGGSTGQ